MTGLSAKKSCQQVSNARKCASVLTAAVSILEVHIVQWVPGKKPRSNPILKYDEQTNLPNETIFTEYHLHAKNKISWESYHRLVARGGMPIDAIYDTVANNEPLPFAVEAFGRLKSFSHGRPVDGCDPLEN